MGWVGGPHEGGRKGVGNGHGGAEDRKIQMNLKKKKHPAESEMLSGC